MGPPPEAVCGHALFLARLAQQIADDNAGQAHHFGTPLPWLTWMLVATGSGAWRNPALPVVLGEWGEPWPNAFPELQIMTTHALSNLLEVRCQDVPGFNQWRNGRALWEIAEECAVAIVQDFTAQSGRAAEEKEKVRDKAYGKFSRLDTDGDGFLSFNEFLAGNLNLANAEEKFNEKDKDGDGLLSLDEFAVRAMDEYLYLEYWNPIEGSLPNFIEMIVNGGTVAPDLRKQFAYSWSFRELKEFGMPIHYGRTAIQKCEAYKHGNIFWQKNCTQCNEPLGVGVDEIERFLLVPPGRQGFFVKCNDCGRYTFFREDVGGQPDCGSWWMSLVTGWLNHEFDADLMDLGFSMRDSLGSEADPLVRGLVEWLLNHANGEITCQAVLDQLAVRVGDRCFATLDAEQFGKLTVDVVLGILTGEQNDFPPPDPMAGDNIATHIPIPEGLECISCASENLSIHSTYLWMRNPPGALVADPVPGGIEDNVNEE
jgi:hypothetical protein